MSNNIGYNDTSYDIIDNWDYKKKRPFIKKNLKVTNFNIILFIILIFCIIYILLNYCIFNFNISFNIKQEYNTQGAKQSELDNRNFCQNSILYILNFKNIYLSSIFYIFIFFIIIYIIYISNIIIILYTYIIKPYLKPFIGCSYDYMNNLKNSIIYFNHLIETRQYDIIYSLFCKFMILLISLLIFIALLSFIIFRIYKYFFK